MAGPLTTSLLIAAVSFAEVLPFAVPNMTLFVGMVIELTTPEGIVRSTAGIYVSQTGWEFPSFRIVVAVFFIDYLRGGGRDGRTLNADLFGGGDGASFHPLAL